MPGLVPGPPLRRALCAPKRDGRDKPGHNDVESIGTNYFRGGIWINSANCSLVSSFAVNFSSTASFTI